jgi:hypothetical protein
MKAVSVAATVLVLLPSLLAAGAPPLGLRIAVEASALPLVVQVELQGGTGPFEVALCTTDLRGATYETTHVAEARVFSLPIPWNRQQVVQVSVEDAAGGTANAELEYESRVRQGEPFVLDAARFGNLDTSRWRQVMDIPDDELHTDTQGTLSALSGRSTQVTVPWPGLYVFRYGEMTPDVRVTVSPLESFQLGIRGMCDDYEPRASGFSHLDELLPRMAGDGVNAVQFIKKLTMKNVRDSVVYDPCPYPDWDERLACAIRQAKSAGFTVMLRLVLWLDAPWPESDATLQALQPNDWAAWFASYGGFVLRYADLAEENGVDIYQFADNLHSTYSRESDYRNLIKSLRSRYSGSLLVSTGPWFKDGLELVKFWDSLDYIGICGSFHTMGIVPYETATRMRTDAVYEVYKASFEREVLPTARRFWKQVLCCEAYYQSRVGSTYSPNGIPNWGGTAVDYTFTQPVSFAEQVRGYDAYLRVVADHTDVFAGIFALQWCLQDPTWAMTWGAGTHNIYSTPAEGLFALWWDGLPSPKGVPTAMPGCPLQNEVGGFWVLWTFGGATGSASVGGRALEIDEGGGVNVGPNSPLDIVYSNPGRLFESVCTLLLNFGALRDLSGYAGILLTTSAEPSAVFQIELDFSEQWIQSSSGLIEIGPERATYFIPFDELRVVESARIQYGLGKKDIDFSKVFGIRVNLLSPQGTLHIHAFTPVVEP